MEYHRYKHDRFSARFPKDFRYSQSHYWMAPSPDTEGLWQIGFTKFATRMLGELVEANFKLEVGDPLEPGQDIGTVEGFKAASDVFCVMSGTFQGMNTILQEDACIVKSSPYTDGWLYAVQGEPEPGNMSVEGYVDYLDSIINQMQQDPKYATYEDTES